MKLYANEISSATSRVRIALAMKGVQVDIVTVGILGDGAENRQADYLGINPQGLVPALQTDEGELLTQSLAIVEYLDERFPLPPLLPKDGAGRAFSRSIALAIASEIHALVPPRVAAHLARIPGMGATGVVAWIRHWILEGLSAVEARLATRRTGPTWPATRRRSRTFSCSRNRSTPSARVSNWSNGQISRRSWIGCGTSRRLRRMCRRRGADPGDG